MHSVLSQTTGFVQEYPVNRSWVCIRQEGWAGSVSTVAFLWCLDVVSKLTKVSPHAVTVLL